MAPLKNTKHEAFVQAVFLGETGAEAYRQHVATKEVSSNVATAAGARLLGSVNVQARLTELKEKVAATTLITREVLEQKVWELAKKAEDKEQLGVAKSCYELLGRDKGAFQERKTVTVRSMSQLTEDELRDELARLESGDQGPAEAGATARAGKARSGEAPKGRFGRVIN